MQLTRAHPRQPLARGPQAITSPPHRPELRAPPSAPTPRAALQLLPPLPRPPRPASQRTPLPWPRPVPVLPRQLTLPFFLLAPVPSTRSPRRLYLHVRSLRAKTRLRAAPRTRADCLNAPRPCPWVSCRYHLLAGPGVLTIGDDGAWHLPPLSASATDAELLDVLFRLPNTCTLDVAALGGISDAATADFLGLVTNDPDQHIIQPAARAFRAKLRRASISAAALSSSLADGTLTFARPEPSPAPGRPARLTAIHDARARRAPPGQARTLRRYLRAKVKAMSTSQSID